VHGQGTGVSGRVAGVQGHLVGGDFIVNKHYYGRGVPDPAQGSPVVSSEAHGHHVVQGYATNNIHPVHEPKK
jgi:hypothetical protein